MANPKEENLIWVEAGPKAKPESIALWERDSAHPQMPGLDSDSVGEVTVKAPKKGEKAIPVQVGVTPFVNERISRGILRQLTETEVDTLRNTQAREAEEKAAVEQANADQAKSQVSDIKVAAPGPDANVSSNRGAEIPSKESVPPNPAGAGNPPPAETKNAGPAATAPGSDAKKEDKKK